MLDIKFNHVYSNQDGEQRLVISVKRSSSTNNHVVIWRTADRLLPKGVKSQGSSTTASFLKWPTTMRKATSDDWNAFSYVESSRKELAQAKQRIKYKKGKQ